MPSPNASLVAEIQRMLVTKDLGVTEEQREAILDNFAANCRSIMDEAMTKTKRDNRKLRLSKVGYSDRKIWMDYNFPDASEQALTASDYTKFLYGHLTEEMMLALVKLTGNEVTDEQKTVQVAGVTGHMDCKINGVIVDVKSASPHGFRKFEKGTLYKDDPFGYIGQNKAYAHAEGDTVYGWLAFNKVNGDIAYLEYDESLEGTPYKDAVSYNAEDRVNHIKKLVGSPLPPKDLCEEPIPDGSAGNYALSQACTFCPHKFQCYEGLRSFSYAQGTKYLTTVIKEPRVAEITGDEL